MSTSVRTAVDIRSFHVEISDEQIDDLGRRIESTRWPTQELVADRSQGAPAGDARGRSLLTTRSRASLALYSRAGGHAPGCASSVAYARADSPTAPLRNDSVPVATAAARQSATNASQSTIARHGRRALQRPIAATDLTRRRSCDCRRGERGRRDAS
jgi:hypothetical protein